MLRTNVIPNRYQSILNPLETEIAISSIKKQFEGLLEERLQLTKVSAPVILKSGTGINDNLNGTERIVSFDAIDLEDENIEIVQSLAKWKRAALAKYGFSFGEGLYTDMRAIRRDELLDNLHSLYVDQWDWEKVIFHNSRTQDTLKEEVRKIYRMIQTTEQTVYEQNSSITPILSEEITFITTQELEDRYPALTPKEREDEIARLHGAVCVMQIGGALASGEIHDGRSPDYDDWSLNADIIVWYPVLNRAFEISSMGIRVDATALRRQLAASGQESRLQLPFHQALINGELPSSIGGGIGQSRLCMFLLRKAHIGEVQVSIWNEKTTQECEQGNITLL